LMTETYLMMIPIIHLQAALAEVLPLVDCFKVCFHNVGKVGEKSPLFFYFNIFVK